MDDVSVQQIIATLDAAGAGEAPASRFRRGKPDGYVVVHANRAGLLRIAREFLAASVAPIDAGGRQRPAVLDQTHYQVHETPEDLTLGWIERVEGLPTRAEINSRRPPRTWKDRLASAGTGCAAITILILLVSGLISCVTVLWMIVEAAWNWPL